MILPSTFAQFQKVYFVDFEYGSDPGERPVPRCMVARELYSEVTSKYWIAPGMTSPLKFEDPETLYIAFFSSAEFGCHLTLGWPLPSNVLDLFVEFKTETNGSSWKLGNSLLSALAFFQIQGLPSTEKDEMRQLALRGGEYSDDEKTTLMVYCESDVVALAALFEKMLPIIDLPRALLRGRYMAASARMEHEGIPVDKPLLEKVKQEWLVLQQRFVAGIDQQYGVYDGLQFRQAKFQTYLAKNNLAWPRLATGRLDLSDDCFKSMAQVHPCLQPLRELRQTLSKMRLSDLPVGHDGRNRCILSPFRARTSRNQPSNTKFIFGPAKWIRGFIKPAPNMALAYLDYEQQEWGIAAALSQDMVMQNAYTSGDPYLTFAMQAGAVPANATKQSHKMERERFKQCALAVAYGMGAKSLALKLNQPLPYSEELLALHKRVYARFWRWNTAVVAKAMGAKKISTVFGWNMVVSKLNSIPALSNFPMQANGAEMLRLAIIHTQDAGVSVVAPVHDALLIEAPIGEIQSAIERTSEAMRRASREVLDGFELRNDVEIICFPNRYMDERGQVMWDEIMGHLRKIEEDEKLFMNEHPVPVDAHPSPLINI
jgi:DNA polymerase I